MEFRPLSGREYPRFTAIKTFFRLPHGHLNDPFDVAILGLPFDGALSYRPGARFGPSRVREASSLGRGFHMESQEDVFSRIRCADGGDLKIDPLSQEKTFTLVEESVYEWLKSGKKTLIFGGDHSITLPILRAYRRYFGEPLAFLHFDAHLDTYPPAWGHEYHHGAFLRHALEEGLVYGPNVIQFGIRGPLASEDDWEVNRKFGIQSFGVGDVKRMCLGLTPWPQCLWRRPTYISFDIDCLDPSYAPGTGTPVPGGLSSWEALTTLRQLGNLPVVGGDVVEISPPFDTSDITSLAGVAMGFEILALIKT